MPVPVFCSQALFFRRSAEPSVLVKLNSAKKANSRLPRLITIFAALLLMSCQIPIQSQDTSKLFDSTGKPNAAAIEAFVKRSGALDGRTAEERRLALKLLTSEAFISALIPRPNLDELCEADISRYCATVSKESTPQCLLKNHDSLDTCCASKVRIFHRKPGLRDETKIKGITVPKHSELLFNSKCQLQGIDLAKRTSINGVKINRGIISLNESGGLISASIVKGQFYRGLPIKDGDPSNTNFHSTGVPRRVRTAKKINHQGLKIDANTTIEFHANSAIASVVPSSNYTDSRGRVFVGRLTFHPSGQVKAGTLAVPWAIPKAAIPSGTLVKFDSSGDFESLFVRSNNRLGALTSYKGEHDTYGNGQVKKIVVPSQRDLIFENFIYPPSTTVEFNADGTVLRDNFRDRNMRPVHPSRKHKLAWTFKDLKKPMKIGVWELPVGSLVIKDERGVLRSATVPNSIAFNGVVLKRGYIEFQSNGTWIWLARLQTDYEKNGLKILANTRVSMSIHENLDSVRANSTTYSNSMMSAERSAILFHGNGVVSNISVGEGSNFQQNRFSKILKFEYAKNGELHTLYADEPVTVNGVEFDGNWVFFHPNGMLRSGILNVSSNIDGVLYAAGTEILQNDAGAVIHSWQRRARWPNGKPPEPVKYPSWNGYGPVLLIDREMPTRRVLMSPVTTEQCIEWFGEPDENGHYTHAPVPGWPEELLTSPSLVGCGITDQEAGVLRRE